MSNLDAASFGAGFGAGQSGARAEADFALNEAASKSRRADMAADRARRGANASHDTAMAVVLALATTRNEISNRWIPYAVTLRASLMANKVGRDMLIEELRHLDPVNADQIAKKAGEASSIEYDRIEASEVREIVLTESEARRTDK